MTQINRHISEENFQRYLKNQMTSEERHLFERELQKHPFEMEALEGFQNTNAEQIQKDLNELRTKFSPKKRKKYYRYWAAAASFLLLITSGLIWFQLSEKSPIPQMAEYKTNEKQDEKSVIPNAHKEIAPENEFFQQKESEENFQVTPKEVTNEIELKSQQIKSEPINLAKAEVNDDEIILEKDINLKDLEFEPTNKTVATRSIFRPKESDVITVAGVEQIEKNIKRTASEKVSFNTIQNTEIFTDSFAKAPLDEALPKAAATKSNAKTHVTTLADSKVEPEIGMQEFKKHLKNEAILKSDYTKRKEVVKLLLKINANGEITGFQNQNKADSLFFEKAKNIILTGSKWNPEIKNGIPIESETKIKIVFRRE